MKRNILLFIVALFISDLCAQKLTLEGSVFDKKNNVIPYASIALLASDTITLITGTISDDQGRYQLKQLKPGNYFLSLSFMGYQSLIESINLVADKTISFTMEDEAYALDEVVVKANRSDVVKQSAMGQTFLLSGSALKKKDILDALQEIPSLSIDPNTRKITLNDGSNPLILVNGMRREGGLSAISAEDILSVDVVPTSSAEFMREGYTSVVNIKVKKSEQSYTSFNAGLDTHPLIRFGIADASLEWGNSKYSFYLSAQSFAFLDNKSDMTEVSKTVQSIRNAIYKRNSDYSDTYFALGGDRSWSSSDYSSFSLMLNYVPQSNDGNGQTLITDIASNRTNKYAYTRTYDDRSWNGSANFYHTHRFDASALDLLLQINLNKNKNIANQLERGETDLITDFNFHNQRIGFSFAPSYQFEWLGFQSKIGLNSHFQSNEIVQRTKTKSEFKHKEWDEYAYVEMNRLWGNLSLAASVGVDLIFRDVEGYKNQYLGFRPVLNLGYKINSHHAFTLNYNMQLTAPDVVQLNPYNTSSDSLSMSTGNPYLKPYRMQQLKLSYTFTKKGFYVEPSVRYRRIDDDIVASGKEVEGVYIQSLANEGSCNGWSTALSFRYTIANMGFVGFNVAYNTISFPDISQKDHYLTGMVNLGLRYKKFNLSGSYGLPTNSYSMYKRSYSSPESMCKLSYEVSSNLDVSLGMRFILSNKQAERWTDMPGYSYYYDNQFTNRGNLVLIGVRYKLQNRKPSRSHEKLKNSDKGFRVIGE